MIYEVRYSPFTLARVDPGSVQNKLYPRSPKSAAPAGGAPVSGSMEGPLSIFSREIPAIDKFSTIACACSAETISSVFRGRDNEVREAFDQIPEKSGRSSF